MMTMHRLVLLCTSLLAQVLQGSGSTLQYQRDPDHPNSIQLQCTSETDGQALPGATFEFYGRTGTLDGRYELESNETTYQLQLSRETEVVFGYCRLPGSVQQPAVIQIVALPDQDNQGNNSSTEFETPEGGTVRLNCPITPGNLYPYYRVTWRSADNENMIFYHYAQDSVIRSSERYSLNTTDFSLSIRKVRLKDAGFRYQCLVAVQDPETQILHAYDIAGSKNLSLRIISEPTIILPPSLVQILPLADVYFRCRARASPNRSVIEWSHSNPDITPTRVFYEESERADGSVVSNSTFIIENVTGKDSGRVKCKASMMYNGQVFETEREATLNVFDVPQHVFLDHQDNGYVYIRVQLGYVLPGPFDVDLRINLPAHNSPSSSLKFITTNIIEGYSHASEFIMEIDLARILFYHGVLDSSYTLSIALRESQSDRFVTTGWTEVPKFDGLYAGVPFGRYMKASLATFSTLIFLIILFLIVSLSVWRRFNTNTKRIIKQNWRVWKKILWTHCCTSGKTRRADDELSSNGFNEDLACKYVEAIKAVIRFGEEDEVIKPILESEGFLMLEAHAGDEKEPEGCVDDEPRQHQGVQYRAWNRYAPVN